MGGVGFFWADKNQECPDLVIESGQIKFDDGLETPVFISAFSDRFVELEALKAFETDSKGWWADLISEPTDDFIGSRLWTIERAKTNSATALRIEDALKESMQWMIDDGIAESIVVSSEIVDSEEIVGRVEIQKPSGDDIPFKFAWDGQSLKISGGI